MHSPTLLGVPFEIRELIYQHLFSDVTVLPRLRGSPSYSRQRHTVTSVLLTNKQVNAEATPSFFKYCIFDVSDQLRSNFYLRQDHDPNDDRSWYRSISRMQADDFYRIRRVYGSEELLHGLAIMPDKSCRPEFMYDVLPGLKLEKVKLKEVTIEIFVHEHHISKPLGRFLFRPETWNRVQKLREMQNVSLPYDLNLRIIYSNDRARPGPSRAQSSRFRDRMDLPSFDVNPHGHVANLRNEPVERGVNHRGNIIKLLDLQWDGIAPWNARLQDSSNSNADTSALMMSTPVSVPAPTADTRTGWALMMDLQSDSDSDTE